VGDVEGSGGALFKEKSRELQRRRIRALGGTRKVKGERKAMGGNDLKLLPEKPK